MYNKILIPFLIIVFGIFITYNILVDRDGEDEKINEVEVNNISMEDVKEAVAKQIGNGQLETEKTILEAVGFFEGSAVATRNFDGKVFVHEVRAEVDDPKEGKFYEGWLVNLPEFFSTGKMIKEGDEYVLRYESNEDRSSFNEVVITEETEADGLDGKPEAHVLEGSFNN